MIRQLPGGGLYTGVSALAGGRDQGELMAEMERLYRAGIRRAPPGGRVQPACPLRARHRPGTGAAAPAPHGRGVGAAGGAHRAAARSAGDRGDVPRGAVPRRAGRRREAQGPAVSAFEEVTRTRAGFDDDGVPLWETTMTGRTRKPASVPEWCAQRIAAMGLIGPLAARRPRSDSAARGWRELRREARGPRAGRLAAVGRADGAGTAARQGARDLPSRRADGAADAPGVDPRVRRS